MVNTTKKYELEFKRKIACFYLEGRRTGKTFDAIVDIYHTYLGRLGYYATCILGTP